MRDACIVTPRATLFCMVIATDLYLYLVPSRELYNVRNIGAYELDEVLTKLIAHLVERSG